MMQVRLEPLDDGSVRIHIGGTLDEESDFENLFSGVGESASVILDLSGVERLNSIGVRRWIDVLGPFSAERPTSVEACSYVVALQANCVANLFGTATVRSTMAPYYCEACRDTRMVLVTADELAGPSTPIKHCPTCQSALAFDELDSYFAFLTERH